MDQDTLLAQLPRSSPMREESVRLQVSASLMAIGRRLAVRISVFMCLKCL